MTTAGDPGARGLDFEPARLAEYLAALFGPAAAPLLVQRTQGGMSNPTYFLTRGSWRAVLRKQPANILMPSAHAIDREFRVLTALAASAVPVPEPLHYCHDRSVLGTPFYLMQWLAGRVLADYAMPGVAAAERRAMYQAMAGTMAALHRLDPAAAGLADYGRPGNYFARQLGRWSRQWQQFRRGDDDNPDLDRLLAWLAGRLPDSELQTLCHGDFRIGNIMFHATEPRVIGVLDWELSTLGHPLADVAFNVQAWRMGGDENGGLAGLPLDQLGIPDEQAYLACYYQAAGSSERMTPFHMAFAMFRAAVGSASVAARGEAGVDPDAARVGRRLSLAYARRGAAVIAGAG